MLHRDKSQLYKHHEWLDTSIYICHACTQIQQFNKIRHVHVYEQLSTKYDMRVQMAAMFAMNGQWSTKVNNKYIVRTMINSHYNIPYTDSSQQYMLCLDKDQQCTL